MEHVRVENMRSKNGHKVPNRFTIQTPAGLYFQSYSTVIAFKPRSGKIQLDRDAWDYSVTTGRYRNQFLGESIVETRKKIKAGEYELVDLN